MVGNAITRGNPLDEAMLDRGLPTSPARNGCATTCCRDAWVLAVAGTHGKTTTTAMLAWILEHAGLNPGFLIGGVPMNFGVSARLADSAFFVIEADEYDTAFFDKRSKFVHYRPRTAILNNLEFDHADIFPGPGGDRDAVPPLRAHGAAHGPPHRQRRGGEPRPRARARLLVGGRALRRGRGGHRARATRRPSGASRPTAR